MLKAKPCKRTRLYVIEPDRNLVNPMLPANMTCLQEGSERGREQENVKKSEYVYGWESVFVFLSLSQIAVIRTLLWIL